MGRPLKEELWLTEAIDSMVRNGISLKQAAAEIGHILLDADIRTLERRKSFSRLVWDARNRFHEEIGSDPKRTKDVTIGALAVAAQKLSEEGEYDKAANVLFQIAKISGWVGPEQTVNLLGELTTKQLDEARKLILDRETQQSLKPTEPSLAN
jgi:hypothetical protein